MNVHAGDQRHRVQGGGDQRRGEADVAQAQSRGWHQPAQQNEQDYHQIKDQGGIQGIEEIIAVFEAQFAHQFAANASVQQFVVLPLGIVEILGPVLSVGTQDLAINFQCRVWWFSFAAGA